MVSSVFGIRFQGFADPLVGVIHVVELIKFLSFRVLALVVIDSTEGLHLVLKEVGVLLLWI